MIVRRLGAYLITVRPAVTSSSGESALDNPEYSLLNRSGRCEVRGRAVIWSPVRPRLTPVAAPRIPDLVSVRWPIWVYRG